MQDVRRPVFMLILLLITSMSPLLQSEHSSGEVHLTENTPSEAERLELASSLWNIAEPIPIEDVELRPSSGILRLQAGEFDPLLSEGPMLDDHFYDLNDPTQTALALLQLHHHLCCL